MTLSPFFWRGGGFDSLLFIKAINLQINERSVSHISYFCELANHKHCHPSLLVIKRNEFRMRDEERKYKEEEEKKRVEHADLISKVKQRKLKELE